jgi:hypothetical protein
VFFFQCHKKGTTMTHLRAKKSTALVAFADSIEKELQPIPFGESENAAEVRALENVLRRHRLAVAAGILSPRQQRKFNWSLDSLQRRLMEARIALKCERGNY